MSTEKPPTQSSKVTSKEEGTETIPEKQTEKELDQQEVNLEKDLKKPELEKLLNISTTAKELQEKHKPKQISFEEAREAAWKSINLQKRHFEDRLENIRSLLSGTAGKQEKSQPTSQEEWYYKRVSFWMKRYENFVGLTDVKASQARVVECEKRFVEMQERRRESQISIAEIQKKIKDIHLELDKTHRGDDKYLVLITQEHNVLKEEKNLSEQFKFFEKAERESFSALSNSVRDSHEKERAQAEKTKYWSVLGSIIGTCIGILGTTINNRLRMRELRQLVAKNSTVEEVKEIGAELVESLDSHEKELSDLTVKVEHILNQARTGLTNLDKMESLVETLRESGQKINTKFLEDHLARVMTSQDQLTNIVGQHQQALQEKLEQMKTDLIVQSTNVNNLAHIQLKDRERDQKIRSEREVMMRKSFENIDKQNLELQHCINSYSKEIDDKVKDVRSMLINDQRIPKLENRLLDRMEEMEMTQKDLLKGQRMLAEQSARDRMLSEKSRKPSTNIDSNLENSLAAVLEEHHTRTRQTVILSTLMVAVFTPIAVFTVSKII